NSHSALILEETKKLSLLYHSLLLLPKNNQDSISLLKDQVSFDQCQLQRQSKIPQKEKLL
ncbi:MAG: hypothetical protein ACK55Z_32930, partial [bacterium]